MEFLFPLIFFFVFIIFVVGIFRAIFKAIGGANDPKKAEQRKQLQERIKTMQASRKAQGQPMSFQELMQAVNDIKKEQKHEEQRSPKPQVHEHVSRYDKHKQATSVQSFDIKKQSISIQSFDKKKGVYDNDLNYDKLQGKYDGDLDFDKLQSNLTSKTKPLISESPTNLETKLKRKYESIESKLKSVEKTALAVSLKNRKLDLKNYKGESKNTGLPPVHLGAAALEDSIHSPMEIERAKPRKQRSGPTVKQFFKKRQSLRLAIVMKEVFERKG